MSILVQLITIITLIILVLNRIIWYVMKRFNSFNLWMLILIIFMIELLARDCIRWNILVGWIILWRIVILRNVLLIIHRKSHRFLVLRIWYNSILLFKNHYTLSYSHCRFPGSLTDLLFRNSWLIIRYWGNGNRIR